VRVGVGKYGKTGYEFVSGEVLVRCREKNQYRTKHQADQALKEKLLLWGDDGLQSYQCQYCRQWHHGHPKSRA
jgi:hypothetical protein